MSSSSPPSSHSSFPKRFKNVETPDTYDATCSPPQHHHRPLVADSLNAPGVPVSSLVHSHPDTTWNAFDNNRSAATTMMMRPAATRLDLVAAPPPLNPSFKPNDVSFSMNAASYSPGSSDGDIDAQAMQATPPRPVYNPHSNVYNSTFRPVAQHKARKSISGHHPYATPLRFSATSNVRPPTPRQAMQAASNAFYSNGAAYDGMHSSPFHPHAHNMAAPGCPTSSPDHMLVGASHGSTGLVTPPGSESPPASLASSLPPSPDTVARFEHEATRLEREAAKRGYAMQLVPMSGGDAASSVSGGGAKERGAARRASFATLLSEQATQATRAEARNQGPGEWTTAKRMIFIDRLITAGYRSLDLAALGAELGLKKKQLVNQLTPGRKGSIRELCLASAAREIELCRGCTKTLDEAKLRAVHAMKTKNMSLSTVLEEHPHSHRGARRSHSTEDDGDDE